MSTNEFEARARAAKVAKLVNGATFCNDMLCERGWDWPKDHAEGLRKLADLLGYDCGNDRMWALIAVPADVATEASPATRALVVAALRAKADEWDSATDDELGRALLLGM